jgi:hypothetical protein
MCTWHVGDRGQARTGFGREICKKESLGINGRKLSFIFKE